MMHQLDRECAWPMTSKGSHLQVSWGMVNQRAGQPTPAKAMTHVGDEPARRSVPPRYVVKDTLLAEAS